MSEAGAVSINQRVKQIREALELSQRNFSKVLSVSHGYVAGIETEIRKVNNRLIKLVVSEFSVNEEWLRKGEGEMFTQNPSEEFTRLVCLFKELPAKYQEFIYKVIDALLKMKDRD
jgi:transcriptional regulator with XRE-family HTH domain